MANLEPPVEIGFHWRFNFRNAAVTIGRLLVAQTMTAGILSYL